MGKSNKPLYEVLEVRQGIVRKEEDRYGHVRYRYSKTGKFISEKGLCLVTDHLLEDSLEEA